MSLIPCPSCARHVRAPAAVCPFCGASVALEARPRPVLPRLGRAAVLAAGASLAACGGSGPPAGRPAGAETAGAERDPPNTNAAPPAPASAPPAVPAAPGPADTAPLGPETNPEGDPGAPAAAYGGPPTPDGPL
jgi:hypothetical protein